MFILSGIIPMKHAHVAVIGNKKSITANTDDSINWDGFAGLVEMSFFLFSHAATNETHW